MRASQVALETQQQIILDYQQNNFLLKDLIKKYQLSYVTISTIFRNHNIQKRDVVATRKIIEPAQRKYSLNENFFATQTPDMAYLLGFLGADGCVSRKSNEIVILLAQKDAELLQKIASIISLDKPVKLYTDSNGRDCAKLSFSSSKIKEDLANYGIVPHKTLSFSFPEKLDKRYYVDFIRGFWDGDGWISRTGSGTTFGIVCANENLLQTVIDFFEDQYQIPKVTIYSRKRGINYARVYEIHYMTRSANRIFDILYDTSSSLFLARKKEKFFELKNRYTGRPELLSK